MRCSGGRNFELPCSVVARTKSSIACLAAPSFHDGNGLADGAVCADAGSVRSGPDKAGNSARLETRARRLVRYCRRECIAQLLIARRRQPQLFQRLIDRERAGPLPGREILKTLNVLRDDGLRWYDDKGVLDEPSDVIASLIHAALERIGAQVDELGHAQLLQRLGPDVETLRSLLHEHRLPLLVAEPGEVAVVGPVEEFATLVRPLAGKNVALVVAVEVDPEGLAGGLVALQQLALDVRLAGGGNEGGAPVLGGEDFVDLPSRRNQARPAHHRRHAVAAFPIGVLLAAERRGAAIRP